jgi:V/A-type H+/Na+-transporting ATPase subunit C
MPGGGVSGYAAMNARVRSMYSTLLSQQELGRLADSPDFETLITQLKRTPYGPYLDKVKDRELTPRRAAFLVRSRLADAYTNIINTAPVHTRSLLAQLYRIYEVDNLKAVLRGIVAGASWDQVRFVLFPVGSMTVVPAQAMLEAGSVAAAVELLRGTRYYDTLSHAMKRYTAEQSLFPLEVALDLDYWLKLWQEVNRLPVQDRAHALRVIGPLLDETNLMWAIRYRVYHHLSEEELINYTLPFGYHVHDDDIRSIAAGANIAQLVRRIYPRLTNVDALLEDPQGGLTRLELLLQREVVEQARAAFLGSPFHIGVPLAYLILHEMEVQDLTVLIEAKSSKVPVEGFRSYLLMGSETAKA